MKSDNLLKPVFLALISAIVIYTVAYAWIENRRHRKGPWEVNFTNSPAGMPMLIVNQAKLGITNVQIVFTNQSAPTNSPARIEFRQPRPTPFDLPFGQCIFMDLTFLPGTITVRMFDHEIEFLPRTMVLDRVERAWHSGEAIMPAAAPAKP